MRRPVKAPSSSAYGVPEGPSDRSILRRDAVYRRLLAAADLLSAALGVIIGVAVAGNHDALRPAVVVGLPLVVLVSKTMGLYDRDEHLLGKTTLDEAPALLQAATLYALLIWLGESVFVEGELGKGQVLGLWGILFFSMLFARASARRLARRRTPPERCVVLGDAADAARLQRKIDGSPSLHAEVIGRVPLGPERPRRGGPQVIADMRSLGLGLVEHDIERAVIAPGRADSSDVLDMVRLVRSLGLKVSVLPRLFEVVGSSVEFDQVEGITLLGLRSEGLTKSSRYLKRSMDLVGAVVGLAALAPLLVAISAAIRLTSRGPALFRQKRIGREGTTFEMVKFRTMVQGAEEQRAGLMARNEAEGLFKIAEDPRLTGVGRFLRRSSLDELPQLLNVLRGEMSLVGPRPLVPDEDRRVEGWGRRRLHVTPGMTGVWQLLGPTRIPLNEMVKIDYLYGANWSLWVDLKILARTIPHALGRRGL